MGSAKEQIKRGIIRLGPFKRPAASLYKYIEREQPKGAQKGKQMLMGKLRAAAGGKKRRRSK